MQNGLNFLQLQFDLLSTQGMFSEVVIKGVKVHRKMRWVIAIILRSAEPNSML
jgi:hypothetical protein